MQLSSFLLGIFLIVGVCVVRQATSSEEAAQLVVDTLALENCDPLKSRLACYQRPYRTFDGTCNNLCNITLGSANQLLRRLENLEPQTAYEQPGNLPRRLGVNGNELPNCRRVSRATFRANNGNLNGSAPDFTHVTMTWGQFLDHDITLTAFADLPEGVPNCGVNNDPCIRNITECIGIDISQSNPDDRLRNNLSAVCIPLRRSLNTDGQQTNEVTAYIDGSQVYGSNEELAMRLRDQNANLGLLEVRPHVDTSDMPVLPEADEEAFCRSPNPGEPCYLAGDDRVNENQALMAMHTLWVREHNRIARNLHYVNPLWDDERLFQEARKIVIAELQHITYNEWLAVLFDKDRRNSSGLLLEQGNQPFTQYDPSRSAQMINSFSTAAMRMGHTLIRQDFPLLSPVFQRNGFGQPLNIPTRDYFNPSRFYQSNGNVFGGILLGLARIRARRFDPIFVEAVREELIIEGDSFNGIVGDLTAINCQRGRDHGLPGYVKFREACGGRPATTFDDLADTITFQQRSRLQQVYSNVYDIDLFMGGISEFPVEGSILGFVFTCIMEQQFHDLRFGDRFWYERDDHQTGFTSAQLYEIRKTSLARVYCDSADGIRRIHARAFSPQNSVTNPTVDCEDLPFVNLNVWREETEEPGEENVGAEGNAGVTI